MVRPRRRGGGRRSLPRPDHHGPLEFSYFPAISYSTSVFTAPKPWCFRFVPRALSHTSIESTRSTLGPFTSAFWVSNPKTFLPSLRRPSPASRTGIVTAPPTLFLVLGLGQLLLESSESLHETQVEVGSLPLARNIHGAHSWTKGRLLVDSIRPRLTNLPSTLPGVHPRHGTEDQRTTSLLYQERTRGWSSRGPAKAFSVPTLATTSSTGPDVEPLPSGP